MNLVKAMDHAREVGAKITGIVGRDGGYAAKVADACVIVPTISPETVTAHSEAFQAVVWHLFVSDPRLQAAPMKWESLERGVARWYCWARPGFWDRRLPPR
jgi:D-sedoheptulose 7-phosphate isomerase